MKTLLLLTVLALLSVCIHASGLHPRVGTKVVFDSEQQAEILLQHNLVRQGVNAVEMPDLQWDSDLADSAYDNIQDCDWEHDPDLLEKGYGENLYATKSDIDSYDWIARMVESWIEDEEEFYDPDTGKCSATCGHYTQVVWSDTTHVGCVGMSACDFDFPQIVSCQYWPKGNKVGSLAYEPSKISTSKSAAVRASSSKSNSKEAEPVSDCGDGVVDVGESCDLGSASATEWKANCCNTDCTWMAKRTVCASVPTSSREGGCVKKNKKCNKKHKCRFIYAAAGSSCLLDDGSSGVCSSHQCV